MQIIHSKLTKQQVQDVINLKKLQKRKHIGDGATADVYAYGRDKVIRLQVTNEDYDATAHLKWARFCLKTRSKHVPKIFLIAAEMYPDGTAGKVLTVIERLKPVEYDERFSDDDAWAIGDYIGGYYDSWAELELTEEAKKCFPRNAAYSLRKSTRKHRIWFNDLHEGNWMLRPKDGRLVITDPIC